MAPITPVLLCGGSGSRLWPLSRQSYPKQFVPFLDGETLFQATARRMYGDAFQDPVIVTASDFRFIVTEQLTAAGIDPDAVLIEPEPRDTSAAICAAVTFIADRNPEAILLIAPTDHVIPDLDGFQETVAAAIPAAEAGKIVTFGIRPDRPATGYGYIEAGEVFDGDVRQVRRFVEKPDAETAETYLKDGGFLWNAGIFMARAWTLVEAFNRLTPRAATQVQTAYRNARDDLGFLRFDAEPWSGIEPISFDHAVMEHAQNVVVQPLELSWNDLGDWDAVWKDYADPETGVATQGAASAIDCENSLLWSEEKDIELVGLGLDNIVAVAMADAVLVADKSRTQDVKAVVENLRKKGVSQANQRRRDYRPWGWFETLTLGNRYQVKRILVHPGAALSLQSHVHRAEHWIVVAGSASVTVDDTVKLVSENESIYVPLGAIHRLENPGKVPLHLIEVQTGAYLGEDDIVRYDDRYARLASE